MARHSTPKWRFPLLVVAIGAVAAIFIAFSGHPFVRWVAIGTVVVVGLGLSYLPEYLQAAERTRDRHDQAFRQRRFRRWQKNARPSSDGERPDSE